MLGPNHWRGGDKMNFPGIYEGLWKGGVSFDFHRWWVRKGNSGNFNHIWITSIITTLHTTLSKDFGCKWQKQLLEGSELHDLRVWTRTETPLTKPLLVLSPHVLASLFCCSSDFSICCDVTGRFAVLHPSSFMISWSGESASDGLWWAWLGSCASDRNAWRNTSLQWPSCGVGIRPDTGLLEAKQLIREFWA